MVVSKKFRKINYPSKVFFAREIIRGQCLKIVYGIGKISRVTTKTSIAVKLIKLVLIVWREKNCLYLNSPLFSSFIETKEPFYFGFEMRV